jgi:hypothetical protein
LPAAVFGVPTNVIAVIAPLHLFAQLWYHTCHIKKMGWLEHIIVTPAHHRVHHAINPEYLDKNFGQIFIFWDKLFGTFQEEREDIPAVYGITIPVRTWNPIKINFTHLWLLIKDAWHTQSWKDKFRIWLMPLGWRPSDVVDTYPIYKIEDVYHFTKYETNASKSLKIYLWFQLFSLLLIVADLYGNNFLTFNLHILNYHLIELKCHCFSHKLTKFTYIEQKIQDTSDKMLKSSDFFNPCSSFIYIKLNNLFR